MSNLMESVVAIATAIVGLAIIAVLVSRNAQTSSVINAAGSAFTSALGVATGPVTGGGGMNFPSLGSINMPYPSGIQ